MIIHTHYVAGNLPKRTLVAKQRPTNTSKEGGVIKEGKYLCKNLIAKEGRGLIFGGEGGMVFNIPQAGMYVVTHECIIHTSLLRVY